MSKPVILFLCVANSARSQMAEAFLRRDAGDYFEVHSAGMEPQQTIHPMTYQVMAEKGLDLAGHVPKHLRQFLGHAAIQHLITVCEPADAKCPTVWPGVVKRYNGPLTTSRLSLACPKNSFIASAKSAIRSRPRCEAGGKRWPGRNCTSSPPKAVARKHRRR